MPAASNSLVILKPLPDVALLLTSVIRPLQIKMDSLVHFEIRTTIYLFVVVRNLCGDVVHYSQCRCRPTLTAVPTLQITEWQITDYKTLS